MEVIRGLKPASSMQELRTVNCFTGCGRDADCAGGHPAPAVRRRASKHWPSYRACLAYSIHRSFAVK
eukprot:4478517-Pleurochrysis_carterae.AAC.2